MDETGGVFPEARATYCGVNVRTKGERDIRGRSAEERRSVRHHRSRLIIDDLEPWLRAKLASIGQKTKLAEAIRYALSRWNGLTRFLDDGRIEIDSNIVERSIRPIALNRKNALFAGSDGGGEHWAAIAHRNL
jgi:transposase